jgi:predicted transcriptional regulator
MMANNKEHDPVCLFLRKKYRSIMEIIALMLEAARHDGATLYAIMKYTGINYAQLKKYLPSLVKMGFMEMEIKEGRISFKVSENGLAFLRQYNILRDMLLNAYAGNKQIGTVHEGTALSKAEQRAAMLLAKRT